MTPFEVFVEMSLLETSLIGALQMRRKPCYKPLFLIRIMWCCFFFFFFLPLLFLIVLCNTCSALRTGTTGWGVWAVTGLYLLCLGYQGCAELKNQRPGSPSEMGPAQQQCQEMPVLVHKPLGMCDLGTCQVRRLAKTRRGSVSRSELFPAPNALAIAPRPFWKRLFSSSHEEVGRAWLHKNSTFLMMFLLPFRLKSMRREKIFQAVWRAHNA